ncbi:5057_t:CDS:2, partial [Funneliformis geosporum]
SESESKSNENDVFKCPNREKIENLLTILGPLFRVGTMEGSSWKEDYLKTPFDSSGNNPILAVEMIKDESDRCRIAKSLNIEILSGDLQKNNIYQDIKNIAKCGFNHIIIIGCCYCDLHFLDCYEHVFRWDAMTDILWFFGNLFNAKEPVPWGVSLDGTVWELTDLDSPDECNSHPEKKQEKREE